MVYNFSPFKDSAKSVVDWLQKEYVGIRTGRATPSILDVVSVDAYGSKMPVNQVANISVEGPKSILVTPWDKTLLKNIDQAVRESNLGVSCSVLGEGIRVNFPELTTDRRVLLTKLSKEKFEEARVRLRNEREKILNDIDKGVKEDKFSDDDKFRFKAELQKLVDETNKQLEDIYNRKEKEIQE
jgi:ribosome recycling factor